MTFIPEPPADCNKCARLVNFRNDNIAAYPDWFNGAVPSFGNDTAELLIVGLAPGLQGANKTGRPFTGDSSGDFLYATLQEFDFTIGTYDKRINDGLELTNCMITNAVRCVPPQNKPIGAEIKSCRNFLTDRIQSMNRLKVILALGRIAHESTLSALELKKSAFPFKHGAIHEVGDARTMIDSYHCSRYNTNTGRLTEDMFREIFRTIRYDIL